MTDTKPAAAPMTDTKPAAAPKPASEKPAPVDRAADDAISGFMALDDKGVPIPTVLKTAPAGPYISVIRTKSSEGFEWTTPTGAPLTGKMNPEFTLRDDNLDARLKAISGAKEKEKEKAAA